MMITKGQDHIISHLKNLIQESKNSTSALADAIFFDRLEEFYGSSTT